MIASIMTEDKFESFSSKDKGKIKTVVTRLENIDIPNPNNPQKNNKNKINYPINI